MAKKSMIARETKRVCCVKKYTDKRKQLKSCIKSTAVDLDERRQAQELLQKMPRDASPMRHNRRCQLCGRPHAVYRKFALCRICLREALVYGEIPGGRKASW